MLRPECDTCPGKLQCEYLSDQSCQLCPFLLNCPAETLAQGFQKCEKTKEVYKELHKDCRLKVKFTTVGAPESSGPREDPPMIKFQCMRCASYANAKRFYESKPLDTETFDMFAETEIRTVVALTCSFCQLVDKVADTEIQDVTSVDFGPVFRTDKR